MNKQINEGPYYIVEQKPRFATTMGGLVVNTALQVLNTNDEVIPAYMLPAKALLLISQNKLKYKSLFQKKRSKELKSALSRKVCK